MMDTKNNTRIDLLDGFRFLAIVLVMLYHYLHRFTEIEGLYPYGDNFSDFSLAKYGYTGVQLFFIISGFVIFLTLEKSQTFREFILKRIIRLFPMLLFCSLTTFILMKVLDGGQKFLYFHKTASAFIPSLTFTEPVLWQKFVNPNIESFVDGVYWTLVIEMRFYILVSILYFLDKRNFFSNWIKVISLVLTLHYAVYLNNSIRHFSSFLTKADALFDLIFLPQFLIYFSIGMFFFMLHSKREVKKIETMILVGFALAEAVVFLKAQERIFFLAFISLFFIFIYRPQWLQILRNPIFQTIGLASYPLYLLHQNIGLLAIHQLASYQTNTKGITGIVIVSAALIAFSYCLHQYFDQPIQKHLKKLLLTKGSENEKTTGLSPLKEV